MNDSKKRILIVDDEEVILFGYKRVLSEAWLDVDIAESSDEARTLIDTTDYDAAILDLRLSNSVALEGLDLISFVKTSQQNCFVIVVTAYGDETTKRDALDAGADLFLEKPVDPDDIKKTLSRMGITKMA